MLNDFLNDEKFIKEYSNTEEIRFMLGALAVYLDF